jgi:hypothetical protein
MKIVRSRTEKAVDNGLQLKNLQLKARNKWIITNYIFIDRNVLHF